MPYTLVGKRTARYYFFDTQAVAIVAFVEERAERGCGKACAGSMVAASGVRGIEFAQQLGEQRGEVGVIGDVGKEAAVVVGVAFPVDTVEAGIVEFVGNLTHDMVEDICTFGRRRPTVFGGKFDRLYRSVGQRDFLMPEPVRKKRFSPFLSGTIIP